MAKVITYKFVWVCDTCSAEIGTAIIPASGDCCKRTVSEDAACITHESSNSGHTDFTLERKIILEDEA